jgi:ABC-type amino acid transport substrate-binding protein
MHKAPPPMRVIPVLLALSLLLAAPAQARDAPRIKVVVATDSWARLMYLNDRNVPSGVLADFVGRMNEVQDKYHFELNIYPRLRVDAAFEKKQADVYPMRTVAWTKPSYGLLPTRTIFTSGDVYFARKNNRHGGHKVFQDLSSRGVAGVRGYHYQLFGNDADEASIKKNFRAHLLGSNEAVVSFVLAGRTDVGIIPEVILATYLDQPSMRAQLIVSDRFDSRVDLSNLVRKDGPISVEDMNAIIDQMTRSGDVGRLRAKLSVERYQRLKK